MAQNDTKLPDDNRKRRRVKTPPALLILNQMAGPMTWELAVDLAAAFGQVALLTGHPDTLRKAPVEGLQLYRSVPYSRGSSGFRFLSWLAYVVHAFVWLCRWPAGTPVLLFSNPPPALWLLLWMRRWRGTPYAVMVHDIFPDVLVRKAWLSAASWPVRLWRRWNRRGYESAQLVMTLGPHMAQTLRTQFDARRTGRGSIAEIPPWVDDQVIQPRAKTENAFARAWGQLEKQTVMYSGNMGWGHDLESLLAAAVRLRDQADVHFLWVGAGPKWQTLRDDVTRLGLTNVTMLGWQPETRLPLSLASADLAFVSLEPELSGLAVPSKAIYFLAAHVPLIAVCEAETELADLVRGSGCGAVVAPGDADGVVEAIRGWLADATRRTAWRQGAALALRRHRRRDLTPRMARLLSDAFGLPCMVGSAAPRQAVGLAEQTS